MILTRVPLSAAERPVITLFCYSCGHARACVVLALYRDNEHRIGRLMGADVQCLCCHATGRPAARPTLYAIAAAHAERGTV